MRARGAQEFFHRNAGCALVCPEFVIHSLQAVAGRDALSDGIGQLFRMQERAILVDPDMPHLVGDRAKQFLFAQDREETDFHRYAEALSA